MLTTDIVRPSADPAPTASSTDAFYDGLAPFKVFADVTNPRHYRSLPADWFLGVADIVDSTQAIAEGRYKAVNTVGAGVIAAITNAVAGINFPFITCDDANLDRYLADPAGFIRGTRMLINLPSDTDRQNVIVAYLNTLKK